MFVIMNIEKAGLGAPQPPGGVGGVWVWLVYRRRVGKNNFDNNQASSFLVMGGF